MYNLYNLRLEQFLERSVCNVMFNFIGKRETFFRSSFFHENQEPKDELAECVLVTLSFPLSLALEFLT